MNIPTEFFILIAGVAGAVIGTLGMHLYYRHSLRRKERETWSSARVYYTRRNQDA